MTVADWRPPYAHIPGRNSRHPEGLFDFLKAGVVNCSLQELPDTDAWCFASIFLDEGFYWEAHELLEAVWMACPPNSAEKIFVQARIQRANAALKRHMGLERAALKISATADALTRESQQRSSGYLFGQKWHYSAYFT